MAGIRNRKKRCCLFLLIVSHKNAIKVEWFLFKASECVWQWGRVEMGQGKWGVMGMVGYVLLALESFLPILPTETGTPESKIVGNWG